MPRARTEVFDVMEVEKPSRCIKFLRLLWKFSRCVFSHVTLISLVVAYCLIGAYAFESLEANHEREVKKSIKNIRGNVSEKLWEITKDFDVLIRKNWTEQALSELKKIICSRIMRNAEIRGLPPEKNGKGRMGWQRRGG
ncbi:uncharacterized protein LOC112462867 [Temnothorax curvispinosus]|uniref:Uncharacterized protein LOC112462180 isoform X2 n=1 Tax=Temnothorax curvispinosus TaxID=300111 RepID=A0A6J1QQE0_9HYME|nr:uncharacterized protein LOC112462180 isoform X2 [Temnothorax curvispinosus]XP_024884699.1 uncharacterized protein LOC112462867 [Temnothorax curvispinosus]